MGHPLIDEFCRAHELRQEFFRRCQRVFRDEVQAQLDERERLLSENVEIRAEWIREVTDLKAQLAEAVSENAELKARKSGKKTEAA